MTKLIKLFNDYCLSMPEAIEAPHFEIISFRVRKKIFATLNVKENRACIKLPPAEQDLFCHISHHSIYAVPNKWGKYGWTNVDLKTVNEDMMKDVIRLSYRNCAPPKLAVLVKDEE